MVIFAIIITTLKPANFGGAYEMNSEEAWVRSCMDAGECSVVTDFQYIKKNHQIH